MKSRYNGNEIVTELSDTDVADIVAQHEFFDEAMYKRAVEAMFCDFDCYPVSVRNTIIRIILNKHLTGKALKGVLLALDSVDTSMFK